jgi:hypothetical protein
MTWAAGEKRAQWWRPKTSDVAAMFSNGVRHVFVHLLLNAVAVNFTFNKRHHTSSSADSGIAIAIDGIASVGECSVLGGHGGHAFVSLRPCVDG